MIHFVGAGCGAADLITVRGARLLAEADCIIYTGSLVNPEVLAWAKADCRRINSAELTLEEIVQAMEEAERAGECVVRLHTGDPSLYGAVREQFEALRARGIDYDVCPGVSAMAGAAAALKLEYTVPEQSQTVIVSRCAGRTAVPEGEELSLLARHRATMVLFLSAGMAGTVQEKLLLGGYPPQTPAAIVYRASWPDELIVRCTLETLARAAEANGISRHALIVVGECLGEDAAPSKLYDAHFATGYREAKP